MILHQNNSTQVVNCGINQSTDIVSTSNQCLFTIITHSPRCSANTGRSSAPSQVSRHRVHQSTWQCQQQAGSTQLPAIKIERVWQTTLHLHVAEDCNYYTLGEHTVLPANEKLDPSSTNTINILHWLGGYKQNTGCTNSSSSMWHIEEVIPVKDYQTKNVMRMMSPCKSSHFLLAPHSPAKTITQIVSSPPNWSSRLWFPQLSHCGCFKEAWQITHRRLDIVHSSKRTRVVVHLVKSFASDFFYLGSIASLTLFRIAWLRSLWDRWWDSRFWFWGCFRHCWGVGRRG